MNQYIINREDLQVDPVTIVTDGLMIGRLAPCEVVLNHPSVSRVQAGIKQIENDYYLFALRSKNPVLLNGKPVEENEALASGDIIEVGPFRLEIDVTDDALLISVQLQIGAKPSEIDLSDPGLSTEDLVVPGPKGKMVLPSPLFPKGGRRSGKTQFNWMPTTDLMSRWPAAFFTWSLLIVGLLSVAAAYRYTSAFAPAPISKAHAATQLSVVPAIATTPNSGSCTNCHSLTDNVERRCGSCHTTEAFASTMIKPHEAAGIGCVDCHAE